jgi:trimethylamine--corrinoid protein Co-methyltransferase
VLADEQIAYARTAVRPLPFDAAEVSAATALIGQVGPGGDYMTHPDTLATFRSFWYPQVFERSNFDAGTAAAGDRLRGRLNARARSLLASHESTPLPDGVLAELADLERAWWARLGEG